MRRKGITLAGAWPAAAAPVGLALFAGLHAGLGGGAYLALVALGLILCVLASVHHAERVGHAVGEPLGTLLLAASVTAIEVGSRSASTPKPRFFSCFRSSRPRSRSAPARRPSFRARFIW